MKKKLFLIFLVFHRRIFILDQKLNFLENLPNWKIKKEKSIQEQALKYILRSFHTIHTFSFTAKIVEKSAWETKVLCSLLCCLLYVHGVATNTSKPLRPATQTERANIQKICFCENIERRKIYIYLILYGTNVKWSFCAVRGKKFPSKTISQLRFPNCWHQLEFSSQHKFLLPRHS